MLFDILEVVAQVFGVNREDRVGGCATRRLTSTSNPHDIVCAVKNSIEIAPARGKLGVLLVGLGAVATTFIAGVQAIRKGLAAPIGSLTQMGTSRLGKRTEGRSPQIKNFLPLASLDDLVFGGWDIFEDDCYEAARTAGVLEPNLLDQVKGELSSIKPWPAVFDRRYVKRLDGPNVKRGATKRDLAEQVRADIHTFKQQHDIDRLVMVWCGSTEVFMSEGDAHASLRAFEQALDDNDPAIPSSMVYAYAALKEGIPYRECGPESERRHAGFVGARGANPGRR